MGGEPLDYDPTQIPDKARLDFVLVNDLPPRGRYTQVLTITCEEPAEKVVVTKDPDVSWIIVPAEIDHDVPFNVTVAPPTGITLATYYDREADLVFSLAEYTTLRVPVRLVTKPGGAPPEAVRRLKRCAA